MYEGDACYSAFAITGQNLALPARGFALTDACQRLESTRTEFTLRRFQNGRLRRAMFLTRVLLITLFLLAGLGRFALVPGEQLLGNLFDLVPIPNPP
jgi:hypothetical protein